MSHLDPRDRDYLATLAGEEREVVLSTLQRFRREERLRAGDPLPRVRGARLEDGTVVPLADLVDSRPLVLVFGSFT